MRYLLLLCLVTGPGCTKKPQQTAGDNHVPLADHGTAYAIPDGSNIKAKDITVSGGGIPVATFLEGEAPPNPSSGHVACYNDVRIHKVLCIDSRGIRRPEYEPLGASMLRRHKIRETEK